MTTNESNRKGRSRRAVLTGMAAGAGLLVAPGSSTAQAADSAPRTASPLPDDDELEAFLDEQFEAHLDEHDIAGATVSVVADGELRVAKGYGYADIEAGEPVRAEETPFRIGSVSKPVTATAVVHAVEHGLLDLETDVNEYLDGFEIPDFDGAPITLEHLLTHTPGFENVVGGLYAPDAERMPSLQAVVTDDPPERIFGPGEVTAYSNYGFGLAGHLIAEASGMKFADYVREYVFDPLGMDRSTVRQPPSGDLSSRMANAYSYRNGEFHEEGFEYIPLRPAGSMSATATDVGRFMLAHLGGGRLGDQHILDPEAVEEMHGSRFSNHPEVNGVGYGFYELDRGDLRIVAHDGDTDYFHSRLALFPDHDVGLFVSYNSPGGRLARQELFDAFVEEYVPPAEPEALEPDGQPSRADDLEGWYRATQTVESSFEKLNSAASVIEVSVDDDALVTSFPGQSPTRWIEVEPLVFREETGHDRLAFREDDGEITHVFLGSMPMFGFGRLSRREHPLLHAGIFLASALAFVSAAVGWSADALWRRFRDGPTHGVRERAARWTVGVAAASLFAPLLALLAVGILTPESFVLGMPVWFHTALVVPLIGGVAALTAVGFAVHSWQENYWGPAWADGYRGTVWRVHYALVVLAAFAFAWLLAYWNLVWTPW